MKFRSSNVAGFTHFGGDVTAQVNSSHGVQLSGGSTGGIVQAVGDDANITLTLRGAGTGNVAIGNSSSLPQVFSNAAVGSTAAVAGLGNIGGVAGPTSSAQVGWIKLFESSGGAAFIPYWK